MTINYASAGVDYNAFDHIKRLAQQSAAQTSGNLDKLGLAEVSASRGESAYVWQAGQQYNAFVIEGLGTKNLVADALEILTHKSYYAAIAQDTVAMIVNDLIVVGAQPQVVNAYFAVGSSDWFEKQKRAQDLIKGWAAACQLAGASWGGGETPILKDIIQPGCIDLAGACFGSLPNGMKPILGDQLQAGDVIILVESNGIHANGLTLARALADKLPKGYLTKLSNRKTYGETLLQPTHIYAQLVAELQKAKLDLHYLVNITGHGWRKLMRATPKLRYVIDQTVPVPAIFEFIQAESGNNDTEMYGTFNMGAGFAIFLPANQAKKAQLLANKLGFQSWHAGYVEKGPKEVVIQPKNISFSAQTLGVR